MSLAVLLAAAALAATPDGFDLSVPPDLRSYSRGADAVAFDPAAPAFADGFELQYRHRFLPDEDGFGRIGTYAALPLWRTTVYGGFEWRDVEDRYNTRGTFGLAMRMGPRLSAGFAFRKFGGGTDGIDGRRVLDIGVMAEPTRWLSLSFGVDSINQPNFDGVEQRARIVMGAALRPIRGADWLSVGAETRLVVKDGARDRAIGRTRLLLDISPVDGLHVQGAYSRTVATDAIWVGLSVAMGKLEFRASGLMADAENNGRSALDDGALAVTFRAKPSESLVEFSDKRIELVLSGKLQSEPSSVLQRGRTLSTAVLTLHELAKARDVGTVLLKVRNLEVGLATVDELIAAVRALRSSGKRVEVELHNADEKAYLVAAAADSIRIDPLGRLRLDGFTMVARYFADTLDKVGIRFDSVEIGKYKSGPDPLTKSRPRPESNEIAQSILAQAYRTLAETLAEERNVNDEALTKIMEEGILTAERAKELGLVDGFTAPLDASEKIPQPRGGFPPSATRRPSREWSQTPIIQVVPIVGTIAANGDNGSPLPGPTATAPAVVAQLRAAASNPDVRAVVLRVESPGGDVGASEHIWRAVRGIKDRGKPVVVSMGDVAASGGYWVSSPADRIFAQSNTVTGSIGIFMVKPDLSGFFEWVGVHNEVYKAGPAADQQLATRGWTDADRARVRKSLEAFYDDFIERVSLGRGMTEARVRELAEGKVYTGAQAQALGLVDELGGLQDAIDYAKAQAGLAPAREVEVRIPLKPRSLLGMAGRLIGAAAAEEPQPIVKRALDEVYRTVVSWSEVPLALMPIQIEVP